MASASNARVVSKSRRKADVWNEFIELIIDNQKRAQCKRCGQLLSAGSNTSLRRHVEVCKKKAIPEDRDTHTIPNDNQPWMFNQLSARMAGMRMVVQESLPFNLLERPNVVRWIRDFIQPQWEKVSRTTLKRDAINNWKLVKNDMIAFFENFGGRVALTCDMWSSPHNLPETYICITCHYINDLNWQMVKRTITFESLPHPHSGERIYQVITSTINEYKIRNKIITVSFDNATNNDNAIRRLKDDLEGPCNNLLLHTRCVCHILNLVVGVVLENFKDVLNKFRQMNNFIFKNGKKMSQAYHTYCKQLGVRRLKAEMDMPVRWNSTYKMIKRLLKQKEVLSGFYAIYNRSANKISDMDWNVIVDLVDLLSVFYNASTKLSGVYYPTSPIVLGEIVLICEKLSEYRIKPAYKTMIGEMLEKLFKYFKEFPPIFMIAATLNPILNKREVTNFLELIEDYVTTEYFSSEENITLLEHSLGDLFRYYKNVNTMAIPTQTQNTGGSSRSTGKSIFGFIGKQSSKRSKTGFSTSSNVDELSVYSSNLFTLNDDDGNKFNILDWWFNRRNDYPILAIMARDVLTCQASTVASESCFSTSGRLISVRRSKLTTESVELCICLKDYLDSVDRVQDSTSLEDTAIDGLEEELLSGSEQTSYTSGTDDQNFNAGSSDAYYPQMTPDMFQPYYPQMTPQLPQSFQQQQHQEFQPFQQYIQPPHHFPSFYNTEDQHQTQQQFQTQQYYHGRQSRQAQSRNYQLRHINEESSGNEDNERSENEVEENSENEDE